jgi:hypothetical protein
MVKGVEHNKITQNMALDGENEGMAAAFKPLKKVGTGKALQTISGPRKVLDYL